MWAAVMRRGPGRSGIATDPGLWCDVTKDPYLSCARPGIVAAAGVLAAIAEEVALAGQELETPRLSGSAEYRRLAGEPATGAGGKEGVADDLHLVCSLGRAAD